MNTGLKPRLKLAPAPEGRVCTGCFFWETRPAGQNFANCVSGCANSGVFKIWINVAKEQRGLTNNGSTVEQEQVS